MKKGAPRKTAGKSRPAQHPAKPARAAIPHPSTSRKLTFPAAYYTQTAPPPLPRLLVPFPNDPFPTPLVSSSSTKLAMLLSLLVPGLGHWLILRSRHTLGYLLMAFLAWFIALSAVTACWWECPSVGFIPIQLVFILPLAMHLIAAYDVKKECGGWPQKRLMRHVF